MFEGIKFSVFFENGLIRIIILVYNFRILFLLKVFYFVIKFVFIFLICNFLVNFFFVGNI